MFELPKKKEVKPTPEYSFCESVWATGRSPWHIRKPTKEGLKFGGGIDSTSLCRVVKPNAEGGAGGWDVEVDVTQDHLDHACRACVIEYLRATKTP